VVSTVPTTIDTSSRGNRTTPWTGGEALAGTAVDGDAVVRAEHLTKRFGELVAVDDLSFALGRGTVTGFLGPNGAGKTTTLRMLLDLDEPTAGRALVLGERYANLDRPADRVGAVLEAADFHPGRSGRDHLCALAMALGRLAGADKSLRARERSAGQRVDAVLELVELSGAARRRVGNYSLAMRQRLGLAGALLGDPELLILDEPANGLDPEGVRWLRGFLRQFAADGKTVLVSSHALAGEGILSVLNGPDELHVEGVSSARVGEIAYRADVPLHELVAETSTLEDVFLELTTDEAT
jgi:ABC-2 type transport system ATP-binding protein